MQRRDFLKIALAANLMPACSPLVRGIAENSEATLLHFTDCHAQLLPVYYQEPPTNLDSGLAQNKPPHLTGQQFLKFYDITNNSREAYAFTHLDFVKNAQNFGKTGGFAHLATLIKQLRANRGEHKTLLLDGGDTWQGSATALWTQGADMVQACNLLGVDVMTGHWEFTYEAEILKRNLQAFKGEFLAQNIHLSEEAQFARDTDNDKVFKAYTLRQCGKVRVAIIGQAFPFTPIANPKRFVKDWQFGIKEQQLQQTIDEIRANKSADVVVLLSHNGMDVDLKLASRVKGLDIILGGHTHDAIPQPVIVNQTWVTNAGSHGKFLAVLDLQVKQGRLIDINYQLLPVFSDLISADTEMQQLINKIRQPYLKKLRQPLAVTKQLLYRRDNFYGTFDQLLVDALREVNSAEIAFSPGFRWGSALLPEQTLYFEDVMNHTAITYPETSVRLMTGLEIKNILEDVADNLFNPDPYYQQGGDMVRVGGLHYRCFPKAKIGQRIQELRLNNGELLQANQSYQVAGWANVATKATGLPIWSVVSEYLEDNTILSI